MKYKTPSSKDLGLASKILSEEIKKNPACLNSGYSFMPTKTKTPLRFEYWKSVKNKQWYWRIKAGNAEPIAQGEGYKQKAGVMKVYHALFDFETQPVAVGINDEAWKMFRGWPPPKKLAKKKPRPYEGHINRQWP